MSSTARQSDLVLSALLVVGNRLERVILIALARKSTTSSGARTGQRTGVRVVLVVTTGRVQGTADRVRVVQLHVCIH